MCITVVKNISQIDFVSFSGSPGSNIIPAEETPSSACDTDRVKKCSHLWSYLNIIYCMLKVVNIIDVHLYGS